VTNWQSSDAASSSPSADHLVRLVRDRALAELATELRSRRSPSPRPPHPPIPQPHRAKPAHSDRPLYRRCRRVLHCWKQHRHADIEPLVTTRDAHRAALDRWVAEQLSAGMTSERVLDELVAAHPLRLMSMMALAIAQNAEVVAGVPTTGSAPELSRRGVWNTFREELAPSSIWTAQQPAHWSWCGGRGLSWRARWRCRSRFGCAGDALSAARQRLRHRPECVAGAGRYGARVLIAVPFCGVTGGAPWLWWVVLPLLAFLAAYTPAAVNFVVGQVAFSVLVVVLFNILAPTDWQIGLVRVEDAALGVGVSAIVGLLLWPHGAQGQLRSALADLYDAAASSLSFSFRRMLTDANEPDEG